MVTGSKPKYELRKCKRQKLLECSAEVILLFLISFMYIYGWEVLEIYDLDKCKTSPKCPGRSLTGGVGQTSTVSYSQEHLEYSRNRISTGL